MFQLPLNVMIAPGNFGHFPTQFTDLFLCDPTTGNAEVRSALGNGQFSLGLSTGNFAPLSASTALIPGIFANGVQFTDLMLYEPSSGNARFFTTNSLGNMTFIGSVPVAPGRQVVPGNFGFAPTFFTDLFVFDATSGNAVVAGTNGLGGFTTQIPIQFPNSVGMTAVPGIFVNAPQFTDLLFYHSATGNAQLHTTNGPGSITHVSSFVLPANRQVVAGRFGTPIGPFEDILLYDVTTGQVDVYSSNGSGGVLFQFSINGFPFGAPKRLIPGIYAGGTQFTDLVFYEPSSGQARTFTTSGPGIMFEI